MEGLGVRPQPLADMWSSLEDGFVQAETTAAEAARLRLAFYGGAFAVTAVLQKAIPSGETAVIDVLDAIESQIRHEARGAA